MSEEIASLGIKIDASEVTPAAQKLDTLTAAGVKAEAQTDKVSVSAKQLATALAQTGNDLGKATALLLAQADAATAAGAAQSGAATATASAARVIAASNDVTFQSFAAARLAALSYGASVVEAEGAAATAAVEGAAVTAAAHTATGTNSRAITESLVIVREAARGNFTRMAGSASILLSALGLLNVVLIPLVAIAATLGTVFLFATEQINAGAKGSHDLTAGLGLTADQLEKVTQKTVTFGDTFKATFQVLGRDISGEFSGVGTAFETTLNFIATVTTDIFAGIVGSAVGAVYAVVEAWKMMPTMLGGEGKAASFAFADAFARGITDTKAALDKFYSDVAAQARKNRVDEILKQAGKAGPGDSAENGALRFIQEANNQAASQEKLNDAVIAGNISVARANDLAKEESATKSVVAKIELDSKLTLEQKRDLIDRVTAAEAHRVDVETKWRVLQNIDKDEKQLSIMETQLEVLGKSNVEQATALATAKAMQDVKGLNLDPAVIDSYVQSEINDAVAKVKLKEAQDSYNESLSLTADLLGEIDSAAQKSASGLADAFGNVGNAIGGMSTALTSYASQQARFAQEQTAINLLNKDDADTKAKQILLTERQGDASDEFYSNELASAKGFFSTKSGIYQALNAAEGIFNAIQLANSVARVAASVFETTTKTAGVAVTAGAQVTGAAVETATTAVSVANAGVQASAWGVTAIAKAIASLPFPFDLLAGAAVAAALVGFGVAVFGGGGGGSATAPDTTAKDRQATQGAGTVLGDATSKSASIANSLDQLTKNTNTDLDYSNQMVISLKAIQNSIGNLTSLLARQLQVGGLLDTSSLGLGASSSGGGILSSLFGSSKTTTTLLDQGINIAATTIGQAVAGGINASAYQTTQSTKSSSALFGLISSTKTTTGTTNTALPSDFTDQITSIVDNLRSTVLDAATKLGVQGAGEVIDSLALNLGHISLNGLTGSQIQDTLSQVFSALGDEIAAAAVPQIDQLQQVGEGALQTLSRLMNEYQVVDDAMASIGSTFATVGVESLAARDTLVQMSGGIDNFAKQYQYFATNFLTSAQALAPIQNAVGAAMAALGQSSVTTKAQFVSLVQGIDVSTNSGAALYAQLMNIAPAFGKVADAASAIASKQSDLQIKLLQATGNAAGATALQRQKELDALDASLQPLQESIYAAEDAAQAATDLAAAQTQAAATQAALEKTRASMEITLMTDTGNATGALALKRRQELAALDPSLVALQESIYAAEDATAATAALTTANANLASAQKNLDALLKPQINTAQNLANAHSDLAAAYQAESSALQGTIDKFGGFATSLKAFGSSLNANGGGASDYATSGAIFRKTASAAQAGDATALGNLQTVSQNFLAASATSAQSAIENTINIATVKAAVASAATAAQGIADNATEQLSALNAQVDGLGVVNKSVLSVVAAINNLTIAQSADDASKATAVSVAQAAVAAAYAAVPGHASGLSRVPYDGYWMKAHEGEAVLTKGQAQDWRAGKGSNDNGNAALIGEVRALRHELETIRDNTASTAKTLKRVMPDGDALQTRAVA